MKSRTTTKLGTVLVTVAAAVSIAAVIAYTSTKMNSQRLKPTLQSTPTYPNVAVINAKKGTFQAQIEGYGEATAKYNLQLSSEIAGTVKSLSDKFETGAEFKQDELLLGLNTVAYEQYVAAARAELAQAKLDYLEEQRQGEQALTEWQASGMTGEPDSPLVLRQPQLDAANSVLLNAQKSLDSALRELQLTQIRAPFDAVVVSRSVDLGSYIQQGAAIATLASTDRVEIRIPLSSYQWQNLEPTTSNGHPNWPAEVINIDGTATWAGYVQRVEQHLDSDTRQRSLVVVVDKPLTFSQPLLAGTFVKVAVSGRQLSDLWQVPAAAITQDNMIWYVDENGQLARFIAQKQFEKDDAVYILPPADMERADIVARPLNTYTQGMLVNAVAEGQS